MSKKIADKERCCEQVSNGPRAMSFHRCKRAASVVRGGKPYCKQHDPKAVEERRAAKLQAEEEKWDRRHRYLERQAACAEACEGVPTHKLKPGLLAELLRAKK